MNAVSQSKALSALLPRLTEEELGQQFSLAEGRFYGVWQHFYPDNFSGTAFSTHYVVLGFRLKIDSSMPMLPSRQHDNWRWAKSDELVRDETVHKNTRAYFDPKMQQQVPGI